MTPGPTATKTHKATLAPPMAHEEWRRQRTVTTYQHALEDVFESGSDTQSTINEVVMLYTLTSYAKDALKSFMPKLRDVYNASELRDDLPVWFTNHGLRTNHSEIRQAPIARSGNRETSSPLQDK